MVVVHSLTNRVCAKSGRRYYTFKWDNIWVMLIGLARKERQQIHPYENMRDPFHNPELCFTNHAICWFDRNVLQEISPWNMDNIKTLRVRLRIVQGMMEKNKHIPKSLLPKVQAALVDIFYQFYFDAWDFRLKYIDKLPF